MIIKDSNQKTNLNLFFKVLLKRKKLVFIILFFVFTLLSISTGVYLQKTGLIGNIIKPGFKLQTLGNYIKGLTASPERIMIDIKHREFQKLAYRKEVALREKILLGDNEYLPAKIRYKDKTYKIKIRLKGDIASQFAGDKWSFRIKMKDDKMLFGMECFSIHHPDARSYIHEWVLHEMLKKEDVISLRYKFVNLTLNGKDMGTYAIEEHFDKRLLENNGRKEAAIIKFNEDVQWSDRLKTNSLFSDQSPTGLQSEYSSIIDAFDIDKIREDRVLYEGFNIGKNLLESFRRGKLATHQVFDTDKLSKYFAISEVTGALHGAGTWHNLRFYYNPITSLLEPIGFDGEGGHKLKTYWKQVRIIEKPPLSFYGRIFSDQIFFEEYLKNLKRISEPSYLDDFFASVDAPLKENLNIIHKSIPYFHFSKDILYENQRFLKSLLNPAESLHVYFKSVDNNSITLEAASIQALPVEVVSLSLNQLNHIQPQKRIILSSKTKNLPADYQEIRFNLPSTFKWSDEMASQIKVEYKILGMDNSKFYSVIPYTRSDEKFSENDLMRKTGNIDKFPFSQIDENNQIIYLKKGTWDLNTDLIIPKNYKVIAEEGFELNLSQGSKIVSYSSLEFNGSKNNPVKIYSKDSTGQGLVVLNAHQKSTLKHVLFSNLSNLSTTSWELTGAVVFYRSPVDIVSVTFEKNRSEDALNIINTNYLIENSVFSQTSADAFDSDFSEGKISNSSFIKCGNDAIDVSGTFVEINNVTIDGAGDKALSAGENSVMKAHNINIKNAEIAVASKDKSQLIIDHVKITDSKVGFTVFQKKPEFGPAKIIAKKVVQNNLKLAYLVETKSDLSVNGKQIPTSRDSVRDILYGVEYGKASK